LIRVGECPGPGRAGRRVRLAELGYELAAVKGNLGESGELHCGETCARLGAQVRDSRLDSRLKRRVVASEALNRAVEADADVLKPGDDAASGGRKATRRVVENFRWSLPTDRRQYA
jgi:hypothetical protein